MRFPTNANDSEELDEIEARLRLPPEACLGVGGTASTEEICDAYARLATRCRPGRYGAPDEAVARRAARLAQGLREVFWAFVEARREHATSLRDQTRTQRFIRCTK